MKLECFFLSGGFLMSFNERGHKQTEESHQQVEELKQEADKLEQEWQKNTKR